VCDVFCVVGRRASFGLPGQRQQQFYAARNDVIDGVSNILVFFLPFCIESKCDEGV